MLFRSEVFSFDFVGVRKFFTARALALFAVLLTTVSVASFFLLIGELFPVTLDFNTLRFFFDGVAGCDCDVASGSAFTACIGSIDGGTANTIRSRIGISGSISTFSLVSSSVVGVIFGCCDACVLELSFLDPCSFLIFII